VEAGQIASGATGRNGGFFLAGAAPMYDLMRDAWGRERAARIYATTLAAQGEMLAAADAAGARAHFTVDGLLRLGVDAAEAEGVRRHHAALAEDGFPGDLVAEADLPPALRRPGRLGLLTPHDGAVHPVRWLRALAAHLRAEGVALHEHTRVVAPPEPDGDGARVRTASGTIRAGRVVVAMDGGLAALVPAATRVRSRRLNMLATAPAPPGVLPVPVYARDGYEYAQQRPDGRITLGGFSDVDGEASWTSEATLSVAAQRRLDGWLREELGIDVVTTHRWAGVVGYADDPLPSCGPVPGTGGRIHALGGYNGTGHVQGFVAARIVAELLATGASADAGLYAPVG
jgi:glycine/D-amino acid oxidase-like deaminating enzyme